MSIVRWLLIIATTALATTTMLRFWGPDPRGSANSHDARYYCPMHPQITSPTAGECPICHMALEVVTAERSAVVTSDAHAPSHTTDAAATELATVMLSLDRQQAGGIVCEAARRGAIRSELRVPAIIEAAEGRRAEVRVRAAGFVERVAVRESGTVVAAGQPLAWVFSPQVFQAQQELLAARRWSAEATGVNAAAAARQSLELLGMASVDLDAMVRTGVALRAVPVRAPLGGTVVRAGAVLGGYATPEVALYEIADLARVWAVASVWERDLVHVHRGALVSFVATGSAEPISARVLLIEPSVSPETRTARVRLDVTNQGAQRLRPGAYGEAIFATQRDAGVAPGVLTVPRDAVLDTGRDRYVFVCRGDGSFEPRSVHVGAPSAERLEVHDGLRDGEAVVARGAFMVDSESRLRAALAGTSAGAR
jgi:Cu(I)/Ag(I) efflux system membrane fusion protein